MQLEQTDQQPKAIAEDARSVGSLEFPSVSGFGGEAAGASPLSNQSALHLDWWQLVVCGCLPKPEVLPLSQQWVGRGGQSHICTQQQTRQQNL